MRTNSDNYNEFNQAASKDLRLVVKLGFPTPIYLTSHAGIPNIPANRIDDCLLDTSSISQNLFPDEGRSEIGSMSFAVVDVNGDVSDEFRTQRAAGNGLNGLTVELYRGGANMDWSDFRVEQTQQIDRSVTFNDGVYEIQCADIQRAMRNDIFDPAKTALAADFLAGATTLTVFDTSDFEACTHVASFSDQTSGSYYYLKIKYQNGFEIIRATGKTATTFTGCTRGVFGTDDVDHIFPTGEDADSSVDVEEYVYLELPAPQMARALLTGTYEGGTIPARWNLGISSATYLDTDTFDDIGTDWFDASNYATGLILRAQGVEKTDGKLFIEREICRLAGAFLLVGADGKLRMRRMTGVIESADYVVELNADNIHKHTSIRHNLNQVRNIYDIEWSYVHLPGESRARFVRRDILVDATSVAIHGQSKPLGLQFKLLHNERHTYTTLINRFDAFRDRYAGPPITFDADLLPSMNNVEVGDIVRIVLDNVRDYSASGTLDRSFEIQQIKINQQTGRVTASVFGSTQKADPIADSGAGASAELPDGWYNSEGTEMATAGLTIDGSGIMTANGSLSGGTTTRTVYYYLGDFTVQSGVTLTLSGNVELRIRGQLQINGTIDISGGGMAANTAGFIGTTFGGPGIFLGPDDDIAGTRVIGTNSAMPVLEIENNAGVIEGIPADMRGSGGGAGGDVMVKELGVWGSEASGGIGGAGGGSLVTVSRGVGYGASGETDVSGDAGNAGGTYLGAGAGSGGGGSPGCLMHLLDGSAVTFPILSGNLVAEYGLSPETNSQARTQGKASATLDLGVANGRVAYVPKSRDPYPDYDNAAIGAAADGLSSIIANVYIRSASPPSTPTADDGSYNFTSKTLTPPSGWSATPPESDGNPLYVSTGAFSIVGQTGTDETVTWSAPAVLVSDGADGADGADGTNGTNGTDGSDGLSSFVATVYQRASSAPSTPTADDGSYNFTSKTLTPPSGWSATPPAANGNPLYVSVGIFEIQGTSGTDSTVTWTAPIVILPDSTYRDIKFQRSNSQPSTPTGNNPAGWYDAIPSGTAPVWQTVGTKSSAGDLIGSWSTPERIQGITYRGAYSSGTAYILHDVVTYQERTYICVQAGTGNAPSGTNSANAYWDLIAAKGDPGDQATYNETITISGGGPVNLRTLADNHTTPYDGVSDATVVFNLAATVTGNAGVADGGNGGHGIDTGSWPAGASITLTLNVNSGGTVRGGGGGGGKGSITSGGNGGSGGHGGDAIYCQESITIVVNSGGTVEAGGAGGGGGGAGLNVGETDTAGGGGGGGYPNGAAGPAGVGLGGSAGTAGTTGGGGSGGSGGTNAGAGGDGGDVNVNGDSGINGSQGSGGAGGTKGYAIRKNGNTVSVSGSGTITGTQA